MKILDLLYNIELNFKQKSLLFLFYWIVTILTFYLSLTFLNILADIDLIPSSIKQYGTGTLSINRVLKSFIIIPIIEEILMRLPLRFSRLNIIICVMMLSFILTSSIEYKIWHGIVGAVLIGGLFFFISKKDWFIKFYKKYLYIYLLLTIIIFTLFHVPSRNMKFYEIFYTLPQFFFAITLTMIRLTNGFPWAIGLHGLVNASAYFISRFLYLNGIM